MKIKGKIFIDTLTAISKIAIKSNSTEDANTILMYCTDGAVQLIASNSNVQVATKLTAESTNSEKTSFSLNLGDLVKQLPAIFDTKDKEGILFIEKVGNEVKFKAIGELSFPIVGNKTSEFKKIDDSEFSVSFMGYDLVSAINATSLATHAFNEVMCNTKIAFDANAESLNLIAMNGILLVIHDLPLEDMNCEKPSVSALVDGKALKSICNTLELMENSEIKITFTDDYVGLSSGELKVVLPIKKTNFVAYEKLLDTAFDYSVVFNIKDFKKTITATKKVVKDKISYKYDGTNAYLIASGFSKPVNVVSSDVVDFTLPIDLISNILSKTSGTTIKFRIAKAGLIEVTSPENDVLKYITSHCR